MSEIVLYESRGRIGLITLNRPEARNAVSQELAEGVEAAVDRLEADPEVWIGILTGNGPVFSAGADLKAISSGRANLGTARGGFGGLVRRERTKPLIAAVDGLAVAGGCELVLACDLVVASTNAGFGLPEVKRSLIASAGGTARLPRKLPVNLAMEMIMTGDPIPAERAYHHGLVNVLCEPGQAVAAAEALAARINVNAPLAVRGARRAALAALGADDDTGFAAAAAEAAIVAESEDFREGPRAFVEKRSPNWVGR
jgi:enoyl-CoA hydratase